MIGGTDVSAYPTIQSAFDATPTGGTVVVSADLRATETIDVPQGKNLWCVGQAAILASGEGPAVRFVNSVRGTHRVSTRYVGTRSWTTGNQVSSVGVDIVEGFDNRIEIGVISGFGAGLRMGGVASVNGVTHNTIFLTALIDNTVNLVIGGEGFANENHFFGGRLVHSSTSPAGHQGSIKTLIDRGNGNTFYGVSHEGNRSYRSVVINRGAYNTWRDCRFESASPIELANTPYCAFNTFDGGYGILGNPLTILGMNDTRDRGNRMIGPFGLATYGNRSNGAEAAFEVVSTTNPAPAEIRVKGRRGGVTLDVTHQGPNDQAVLRLRDGAGVLRSLTLGVDGQIQVT